MLVEIDPVSQVPPYEQVRGQIESMIVDGVLGAGAKLPTIRQLANDLGLAVNTVARAYRELEAAGLVATRTRSGTTVAHHPPQLTEDQIHERVRAAGHEYLNFAAELGLSAAEAIAVLTSITASQQTGNPATARTG